MLRISNPANTLDIIKKHRFTLCKKYGQNFLIDAHVLDKIIASADIGDSDIVIEIGPGIGSLTQLLAAKAKKVIAVEIDKLLIPILNETLSEYKNVEIVNKDILKTDIKKLIEAYSGSGKIKVVANLPYYITTAIVMKLLEEKHPLDSITVMVQKEVARRMQALPGSKDYGAMSLAVAYYSEASLVAVISPNCFIPKPKVESAVIKLDIKEKKGYKTINEALLFKIIRASFNQRRKTLQNGLINSTELGFDKERIAQALKNTGLNPAIRGEALDLDAFIRLADELAIQA